MSPESVVIDPGEGDPAHLDAIEAALGGVQPTAILLTHTHPDHWTLAPALRQRTGAPIVAFATCDGLELDRRLGDDDLIELPDTTLRALHTPGHAADHLSFAIAEESAVVCGDHVMGWSTTIIAPPDGDLDAYMASLERLIAMEPTVLYPGHGEPIDDPLARMLELRDHRNQRTEQALAALAAQPGTAAELVERIYTDVDPRLHPAARMSLLSHLRSLVERGEIVGEGEDPQTARYRLSGSPR